MSRPACAAGAVSVEGAAVLAPRPPGERGRGLVLTQMPEGAHLVVLIGVPGSGKTELARSLWRTSQVISLDALRETVSDDASDQSATADAAAVMHRVIASRLRRRLTTVVDATNVEDRVRAPLLDAARQYGVCAAALIVETPLPLCLARNATRPGLAAGARRARRVPDQVIFRQYADLLRSMPGLPAEGFAHVLVYDGRTVPAAGVL
jgi:predicted kinase